jgi:predicted nicotinamide N-methyase
VLQASPLVPEISLHVADELVPIWHMTEEELGESGLPPPFWAFAWAGGQALARYILDNPDLVRGKHILDFAAGSGIVAIAAKMAGAAKVDANDIDPFSCAATHLNAIANDLDISILPDNLVGCDTKGWDVILAGDICYEQPLAGQVEAWLRGLAQDRADVLIGDPGRTYLPKQKLIAYAVKTTRELEDTDVRNTCVWRIAS